MVRISEGIWPEEVTEQKYFTSRGEYKVDKDASETMKNSLMYKMSYYRSVPSLSYVRSASTSEPSADGPFASPSSHSSLPLARRFNELYGGGPAMDRVRQQQIPPTPIQLDTLGKSGRTSSLGSACSLRCRLEPAG